MLKRQKMLLLLMPLAVTGCVSTGIFATKSSCSTLVPSSWRAGIPNAPAPAQSADDLQLLKNWIGFAASQTGQLEKANGRTVDTIGIIERCEERDKAAIEKSKPRFLGIF